MLVGRGLIPTSPLVVKSHMPSPAGAGVCAAHRPRQQKVPPENPSRSSWGIQKSIYQDFSPNYVTMIRLIPLLATVGESIGLWRDSPGCKARF